MLEHECKVYAMMLGYCRLLTADLKDEQLCVQPLEGINHPAWIMSHLAIATDYAARLLGEPWACPKDWHEKFGPGSKVSPERSNYPSKAELLAVLEAGHARVTKAAGQVSEVRLQLPQPSRVFKEELPTVGDLLTHLITSHPAIHLGQLSAWRRMMGLPRVLTI
jgi:hypothetical protein